METRNPHCLWAWTEGDVLSSKWGHHGHTQSVNELGQCDSLMKQLTNEAQLLVGRSTGTADLWGGSKEGEDRASVACIHPLSPSKQPWHLRGLGVPDGSEAPASLHGSAPANCLFASTPPPFSKQLLQQCLHPQHPNARSALLCPICTPVCSALLCAIHLCMPRTPIRSASSHAPLTPMGPLAPHQAPKWMLRILGLPTDSLGAV